VGQAELMEELLEAILTMEIRGMRATPKELAEELKVDVSAVEELLRKALDKGLVAEDQGRYLLTPKGLEEVHVHRERYIHDRLLHGSTILGRLSKVVEGRVYDLDAHWHHRHGINGPALSALHRGFMGVEGRVEELVPLTWLRPGSRGVVVFALGGYGLVRRLAEMGLTPGTEVRVTRRAPLRGPIEVQVRGVSLALGFGVASKVIVKPLE